MRVDQINRIKLLVDDWTKEKSIDRAIEELNELCVALLHLKRGRVKNSEVKEEIADVAIAIKHLEILFFVSEQDIEQKILKEELRQ